MYQNLYKRKFPYAAMMVALAGCSGEDDKNMDSSSPKYRATATISAQNATVITEYQDSYLVDLSDKVVVSDGKSFALAGVTSLTNTSECQPLEVKGKTFTIAAHSAKSCDYEYKVAVTEPANSASNTLAPTSLTGTPTDTAITRVAVVSEAPAEASQIELPAISAVTLIEEMVEVNVKDELQYQAGFIVPYGYTLSSDASLPYSGNTAMIDPLSDEIIYTPTNGFEGIERILFSYTNDVTGEVLLGTLDIAVTSTANQGLAVEDDITHEEVALNELTTIDVAPYVTSMDGDDFQLIHVDSFNAAAAPLDPEDLSNTSFTFETSKMGNHYVSFAVSDNNGAYAMGLMNVPVFDLSQVAKWEDINLGFSLFSAPLTVSEAIAENVVYSSTVTDTTYSPTITLAAFDSTQAQNYCMSKGRLPTIGELKALSEDQPKDNHNWPVEYGYLGLTDVGSSSYATVKLDSGLESNYEPSGSYIVTCILNGTLNASVIKASAVANNSDTTIVDFTVVGHNGSPLEGIAVIADASSSSNQVSLNNTQSITDANGIARFEATNTKAENAKITVEYGEEKASGAVNYTADNTTAKITTLTSIRNNQNTTSYNQVRAYVTDTYGNPVTGQTVYWSGSSSNIYFASMTSKTSSAGYATGTIYSSASQGGSYSVTGQVSSDIGNSTQMTNVTFTSPPPPGGCGNCGGGGGGTSPNDWWTNAWTDVVWASYVHPNLTQPEAVAKCESLTYNGTGGFRLATREDRLAIERRLDLFQNPDAVRAGSLSTNGTSVHWTSQTAGASAGFNIWYRFTDKYIGQSNPSARYKALCYREN